MSPRCAPLRPKRFEFFPVCANADTDLETPATQVIKRCDLLRGNDDVASHWENENSRAESQGCRLSGKPCVCRQDFPKARRLRKFRAHIVLGRHVIIAPDRMITKLFGVLGDAKKAGWI